jgi:hypothetical protein
LPAYVVIHFAREVTRSADRNQPQHTNRLKRLIAAHDGDLLPAPETGTRDVDAARVATITVPDMTRATQLAAAVLEIDGIETAYAKPGEELP